MVTQDSAVGCLPTKSKDLDSRLAVDHKAANVMSYLVEGRLIGYLLELMSLAPYKTERINYTLVPYDLSKINNIFRP